MCDATIESELVEVQTEIVFSTQFVMALQKNNILPQGTQMTSHQTNFHESQ